MCSRAACSRAGTCASCDCDLLLRVLPTSSLRCTAGPRPPCRYVVDPPAGTEERLCTEELGKLQTRFDAQVGAGRTRSSQPAAHRAPGPPGDHLLVQGPAAVLSPVPLLTSS